MAGREVREYTNLSDPKDKKWGKLGKDKVDDEDIAFKRLVAKGFWRGTWVCKTNRCRKWLVNEVVIFMDAGLYSALDSDDLLYLKEQMEAEEDAERLRRRTEKRAFAAFKRFYRAASLADASASALPLPLRVEPKPRSGIRQQALLRYVKPKTKNASVLVSGTGDKKSCRSESDDSSTGQSQVDQIQTKEDQIQTGSVLGLAYESSGDERD